MRRPKWNIPTFSLMTLVALVYILFAFRGYLLKQPPFSEPDTWFFSFGDDGSVSIETDVFFSLPDLKNDSQLTLKIVGVYYWLNKAGLDADQICVDQLYLGWVPGDEMGLVVRSKDLALEKGPFCQGIDHQSSYKNRKPLLEFDRTDDFPTFDVSGSVSGFSFPFDNVSESAVLQVSYYLIKKGVIVERGTIIPYMPIWLEDSANSQNWDVSIENNETQWTDKDQLNIENKVTNFSDFKDTHLLKNGSYGLLQISLSRPYFFRLTIPFLLLSVAILICLLPSINELGNFLEASFAVVFSIFGLRQVLIPQDIQGVRTIVDVAILGLYVLFVFALLIFVLKHIFQQEAIGSHTIQEKILPTQSTSLESSNSNFVESEVHTATNTPAPGSAVPLRDNKIHPVQSGKILTAILSILFFVGGIVLLKKRK